MYGGGGGLVTKLCLTPCNSMGHHPPGSSVHGIVQTRILEWVTISFSRGSSWPRDQTQVSCIRGRFFADWATREAHIYIYIYTHTQCIHMCVCVCVCTAQGALFNVMWQPEWEGNLGKNGYMYSWVPLLSTWNYHNIVNWLCSNIKQAI